jgi:hypothetical protein
MASATKTAARARTLVRPSVVLGILILVGMAAVLWKGRDLTFRLDEWTWVTERFLDRSFPHQLFDDNNGHFAAVPVLIFKALLETVGMHPYWPYVLAGTISSAIVAVLVYVIAKPRVGAWGAVLAATPLIFLGRGVVDLGLWPFELLFPLSLAGTLGAMLLLERRTLRADLGASALVLFAVASSGVGLAAPPAVAVRILAEDPRRWRRLWILAAPVGVFGIWYLVNGGNESNRQLVAAAPEYVLRAFSADAAALVSAPTSWGPALAVAIAAAVVWRIARPGPRPAALYAWITLAVTFWGTLALAARDEPGAARYLFPGAVAVVLILVEVAAAVPALRRPSPRVVAMLAAGGLFVVVAGLGQIHLSGNPVVADSERVKPQLTAYEVAGPHLPPGATTDYPLILGVVNSSYRRARERWGDSPAPPVSELPTAGNDIGRRKADALLITAGWLHLEPAAPGGACAPVTAAERFTTERPVAARGLSIEAGRAAVVVAGRRYGSGYLGRDSFEKSIVGAVPAREARRLRVRPDRLPGSWTVRLASTRPFRVCR